jgi:ribosomal protein S18 acetylase RimI-like enzyme
VGREFRYIFLVRYRLCQPGDFESLYAIEEACFQPPLRFPRGYIRRLASSEAAATWVAEDNGRIAGFAIVEWSSHACGAVAYIQTIEVDRQYRGRGIGSELLRRMEFSARQAGAVLIWLHVEAENGKAIRLYERHGYRLEGKEENYYAQSRDALLYVKRLSEHAVRNQTASSGLA